ncbi:ras guanine nucleotide exchange factor domain-containing protein [Sporodiniella umbellata]|nr:ras guanine nucleotide exchange factor domain-containing protein [Sporodiniella umbellata]
MGDDGHSWYYYHPPTGTVSYQLPTENTAQKKKMHRESFFRPNPPTVEDEVTQETPVTEVELMENWVERQTPQGRVYFCNLITQETTWDYQEIDPDTGRLKKSPAEESVEAAVTSDEDSDASDTIQAPTGQEVTWNKVASDIALDIRELTQAIERKQKDQIGSKTGSIVKSVRFMLYASGALDKESQLLQEPAFREPRRAITSTLSKLVLDTKPSGDLCDSPTLSLMFEKIARDANDVLVAVRNFVTLCQQRGVEMGHINPVFVHSPPDLAQLSLGEERPKPTEGVAKTRYLLNQDLVVSLQVYSHQIYTSAEELASTASHLHTLFDPCSPAAQEGRATAVTLFHRLSSQVSQYMAILDDINFDSTPPSALTAYQASRHAIYSAIGHMFGAVQTLTDLQVDLSLATSKVDASVVQIESVIETVEQGVIAMVQARQQTMQARELLSPPHHRGSFSSSLHETESIAGESDFGAFSESDPVMRLPGISDIVNRRRQQSIRPEEDRSLDTLGYDHAPDALDIGPDGAIRGGTLAALVERLTVHNTADTNFIATFLLTYRSFCTSEEFVTLLEERYHLRPPERLTPDQLELWTERKQKLVRLRVFNVIKSWLENYYIDEDEPLLARFEHFTKSYIRDSSEFAAKQILNLISKRQESGDMKKIVPTTTVGPEPILPKNMETIKLSETDPVEMARQLSVLDFKLYSSIRPIECLGKAWSKDGDRGSVAMNIKQSIQYCNRLTSWVTDSILSYDEPKKRASVIKYWVNVAEQCRTFNNFNTCMAILSAFDNSAIGRLKKTWMMSNRNTTQTLASIRKLLGANRNFTEYREIIHSINPPCIPFLGIYLQDLTFIEDGNSDFLRKSNHLINFAKRQKVADVIQELRQRQNFAYNFITIPEFQEFIQSQLDYEHDTEKLYERSLLLEPRMTETTPSIYLAGNVM